MKTSLKLAGPALALILSAGAFAAPAAPAAPATPAAPALEAEQARPARRGREIVQFGKSVVIREGETADSVVVIGGSVEVLGAVRRDVVAVGGGVRVSGSVGGDAVAIGGSLELREKASVGGDAVAVGGQLEQHPTASVGGSRNSVDIPWSLPQLGWLKEWVGSGLLMGRPLPPGSGWAWALSAAMLLVYLLISAAFPAAVDRCAAALSDRPATALGVGALSLAMAGPALLLLVISVVGIAAVPLAFCAAGVGIILGKAAVYRTVGGRLGGERLASPEGRVGAVLLGAALFTLLYAVPGAGFVAWGAALLFGLGGAVLAFSEQFRGETSAASAAPAAASPGPAGPGESFGAASVTAAVALGPAAAEAPGRPAHPAAWAALPRATFMDRMGAIVVDAFAFLVIVGLLPLLHAGLAAWAVYQVGLWTWKGTTLGGIVCGIKGVRVDGSPFDLRVALVRHLASYLSVAAGFLGFLWAAWDPERQTWHDKIAGTIVVRVPKGEALL